jgi:hypothetical protein
VINFTHLLEVFFCRRRENVEARRTKDCDAMMDGKLVLDCVVTWMGIVVVMEKKLEA